MRRVARMTVHVLPTVEDRPDLLTFSYGMGERSPDMAPSFPTHHPRILRSDFAHPKNPWQELELKERTK